DKIKNGLCDALSHATGPVASLDDAAVEMLFNSQTLDWRNFVIQLVMEGVFAAPEYGGNRDLGGWQMAHFEGDSQPLGYSIFDPAINNYRERPDYPNSTANPGPDPDPMDTQTQATITMFTRILGGRVGT